MRFVLSLSLLFFCAASLAGMPKKCKCPDGRTIYSHHRSCNIATDSISCRTTAHRKRINNNSSFLDNPDYVVNKKPPPPIIYVEPPSITTPIPKQLSTD